MDAPVVGSPEHAGAAESSVVDRTSQHDGIGHEHTLRKPVVARGRGRGVEAAGPGGSLRC